MNSRPALWHAPLDETAEDDCACAGAEPAATCPAPVIAPLDQPLRRAGGLYQAPLDHEHALALNPGRSGALVVMNGAAQQVLDAYAQPDWPELAAHRRPAAMHLEDFLVATQHLTSLGFLLSGPEPPALRRQTDQILTAWLHVTNACNLRCTYCYINKSEAAMDQATGQAAVEAVFRSAVQHGFRAVKLKYAGGEATLNFPLIQALQAQAQRLAATSGIALRAVVLSNGVGLTEKMIGFIRDHGLRLMISLDGVGEAHDRQRVFANGRGSYQSVARGIDRAVRLGLRPHLSITVTRHNAAELAAVVAFALERDLLFNLNLYREHDCASIGDLRAGEPELIAGMRRAFQVIESHLPRRSLFASLVDRSAFAAPHTRACGAGHSYLVIDERGGVARCQMEIEKTVTSVFADDPLLAIRAAQTGFQNVDVDDKPGCRDCAWRYWCAGGCSLLTYRVTGRSDVRSPNCNVYQALYPDLVRLEGLRLLKWSAPLN